MYRWTGKLQWKVTIRGRAGQKPCAESRLQGGCTLRPLRSLFTGSAALSLSMAHLWKSRRLIRMGTLKQWNGVRNNVFLSTLLDLDVICLHECVKIKCTEIKNYTFNWRIQIFFQLDWYWIQCNLRHSLYLDNKQEIKHVIHVQCILKSLKI